MTNNINVSVAILTWNRSKHVLKAIESALNQTYMPYEIVVVDSASTDGTIKLIENQYPEVKIIRLHRNMGCPEGRNVALANCTGDIIYALDDDGWLEKDTLEICVNRFSADEKVAVVGCRILAPEETPGKPDDDKLHHTFSGGASAIRRSILQQAGYYPSDFFRQAEEGDLSLRIIDSGYKILKCPAAIMYHERSPINRNDKLFHFYNIRNELYTVIRRYPAVYVLPFILQKIITWNWLGLRVGAIHYTVAGTIVAILNTYRLFSKRKSVSIATVNKVISLKSRARRIAKHL